MYAFNVLMSIALGLISYRLSENITQHLVSNLKYSDKINQTIIINILTIVVCFFSAHALFGENSKLSNKIISLSCYITGFLIMLNTILSWDDISDSTKTVILFVAFILMVLYSYSINNK